MKIRMKTVTSATDAPHCYLIQSLWIANTHINYVRSIKQTLVRAFCLFIPNWKAAYLWITVLGKDLQHRRFSALNISYQHQFTSHHQWLCISSFLHGYNDGPVFGEIKKYQRWAAEVARKGPSVITERPGGWFLEDARSWSDWICHCGSLYRGATANRRPYSTGCPTSRYCTHWCSQRAKTTAL